jgi:hypothetical protein
MNTPIQQVDELLCPRFKVIADWPMNINFKVGEIVSNNLWFLFFLGQHEWHMKDLPHLFKPLAWWEHRTIEELQSVKFVKVIIYRGYWVVGDIVPVIRFEHGSIGKATPTGYYIGRNYTGGNGGHYQPIFELEPATEAAYLEYQKSKKLKE